MEESDWNTLVDSLRHRRCVLVIGPDVPADVSSTSGGQAAAALVTYADALKDRLAKELDARRRDRTDATSLAGVAQQYEDAEALGLGSGKLKSQAARFYESLTLGPSAVHDALARLPFPLIISTCHDRLMFQALKNAGREPLVYRYHFRGDLGDNPEFKIPGVESTPVIYHLFGSFEDAQSLIISENDFLDFLKAIVEENPPMPHSLRRALQRRGLNILFVGFGIRHFYLRVLLKVLIRSLSLGRSGSAVAVEPLLQTTEKFDREQAILFYQRGSRIEVCDDEIFAFVGDLSKKLDAAGGVVDEAPPLCTRPRVFLSYASEDRAFAARIFETLQRSGFEPWWDKDALHGGQDWNATIEAELREEIDYVLVLQTPALARKLIGYVNKEITIAADVASHYRGGLSFLIPLDVEELAPGQQIQELSRYHHLPLRPVCFDSDMAALITTMRRDYQLRERNQK
jgi:hypothetical protein